MHAKSLCITSFKFGIYTISTCICHVMIMFTGQLWPAFIGIIYLQQCGSGERRCFSRRQQQHGVSRPSMQWLQTAEQYLL